jgi:hypothetical protein
MSDNIYGSPAGYRRWIQDTREDFFDDLILQREGDDENNTNGVSDNENEEEDILGELKIKSARDR